ncbi:ribosomal protein L27 [Acrasis kona]|uniref:60S ribosomal protein L27 n=1 Tax=Acrasis kona TaxID=1008807 RepID=A0AAW2YTL5_9EUKA
MVSKTASNDEPQKFLKPGKVVIVLQGRFAGKKAVIVKNYDEKTTERPFPHAVVAGIARYPRKVVKSMSKRKISLRSHVKPFVKTFNYQHLMPTRYGVDIDLKGFVSEKVVKDRTQKKAALQKIKRKFEARYLQGKNRWFFTKLRF